MRVTIALLGAGKMGFALLSGWLDAGYEPEHLVVAEADGDRRRELEAAFGGVRVVPSAAWAVPDADAVVVAVKPSDVGQVLSGALLSLGESTLVISIAAGVTIATIESAVPGRPVVRAMPNTPATVRQGAAGIAAGTNASLTDVELAVRLLSAVGTVVQVEEKMLDAVTGLSGSGPAYVFLVAEALIEAGVLVGLSREISTDLVIQTLAGSAALLSADRDPEQLRASVTSPGGTTAAGLRELEKAGLRAAFLDAVTAATSRSKELGN